MPPPSTLAATISLQDLEELAEITTLRLPLREPETRRCASVSALLDAEVALARAFTSHVHSIQINFSGTHRSGSLAAETATLGLALARFAETLHHFAAEHRHLLAPITVPSDMAMVDEGPVASV